MDICKRRDVGLDFIKILAAIFVVKLHCGGEGYFADGLHYICGSAIPLFLMVSGALILNKQNLKYSYIFSKIGNVFIIMILWSLVLCLGKFMFSHTFVNPFNYMVRAFRQEGALSHFWYLWMLIPVYCVCPILVKLINVKRSACLTTVILFCVCSVFAINSLLVGQYGIEAKTPQALRIWIPLMYFWCGGLLYRVIHIIRENNKQISRALYFIFIVIWIGVALLEKITLANVIGLHSPEYLFSNPFVICFNSCLFIFLLMVKIDSQNKVVSSTIIRFSQNSFGVYIIHMFIISTVNKYVPGMNWFLKVLVVVVCSFAISDVVRKIPVIKRFIQF